MKSKILNWIRNDQWKGPAVYLKPDPETKYKGVVNFLTVNGTNPHNIFLQVEVSGSEIMGDTVLPQEILDPTTYLRNERWCSENKLDEWYGIKFLHSLCFRVNGYAIRQSAHNINQPANWMIEGSLDGQEWTLIHNVVNYPHASPLVRNQFNLTTSLSDPFNRLRIRMTGPGIGGNGNWLILSGIEFFGQLWPSCTDSDFRTPKIRHRLRIHPTVALKIVGEMLVFIR